MKKKIIITLLLVVPFISIFLVIIFRGILSPNNEEIIRDLKNIKCYETKVEYIVKNSKGEEREDTVQYYSKDEGVRVEFDDGKVKLYKSDGIHVKDNSSLMNMSLKMIWTYSIQWHLSIKYYLIH